MLFDKKAIENLEKGVELLVNDLHENKVTDKHILFVCLDTDGDDNYFKTAYYGNMEAIASGFMQLKDNKGIEALINACYFAKLINELETLKKEKTLCKTETQMRTLLEEKLKELQAQETEYLKRKKVGWGIRLIQHLNPFYKKEK